MKLQLFRSLSLLVLTLGLAASAHALDINLSTFNAATDYKGTAFQAQFNAADLLTFTGTVANELYRGNNNGTEAGLLASSYATVYTAGNEGATISYTGGAFLTGEPIWLLVKDGNNAPYWYLFDLDARNWDGQSDLNISGLWPNNGSISHAALFGTKTTNKVPDGGMTVVLLGLGLASVGFFSRRRSA